MDRDAYLKRCEEQCEAPIQQSHVRLVSDYVPYWKAIGKGDDSKGAEEEGHGAPKIQKESRKQIRKNRQESNRARLCFKVSRGEVCPHGDECKYMHDVEAFLKEKGEDLLGCCPFYTSLGSCPHGLSCRFAGSHSKDGKGGLLGEEVRRVDKVAGDTMFWVDDGSVPTTGGIPIVPADVLLKTVNDLDGETLTMLRKRVYDYSRADGVLESLGVRNSMKSKSRRDHGKRKDRDGVSHGAKSSKVVENPEGSHEDCTKVGRDAPRKIFDARGKTYLAPLTTVGNLPFRRICKSFGADITCGEMAMATNLLQGQKSEWALLKRHPEEDFFGVQICGAYADSLTQCAQLIDDVCDVDFVDLNCGCPIDLVVNKGAGSACLKRPKKLEEIVRGVSSVLSCPMTIKMRRGFHEGEDLAHKLIPTVGAWGASAVVLHGRTREQRYSRPADWDYIKSCAENNPTDVQVIGNGDVFSWHDHVNAVQNEDGGQNSIATTYVARGALIKPWIFTEIKEQRDWDISASERLDIIGKFARNGLEHWGSDTRGVETCRKFMLEWLSFTNRYIPVGLLELVPQKSYWRPSAFVGRSDLETLLASPDPRDWIMISEMFLGKAPNKFSFMPKHKAKSYATPRDGADTVDAGLENG